MRVSSSWNALAAPLLYHTVQLTSLYIMGLIRSYGPSAVADPSKVQGGTLRADGGGRRLTKSECLAFVRHVYMGRPRRPNSTGLPLDTQGTCLAHLSVSTVRFVPIRPAWNDWTAWVATTQIQRLLRAERVVLSNSSPRHDIPKIDAKTIISIFSQQEEAAFPLRSDSVDYCLDNRVQSCAVYIWITSGPNCPYYDAKDLLRNGEPQTKGWLRFQMRLVDDAWYRARLKQVIIVNIAAVNKAHTGSRSADLPTLLQDVVDKAKPDDIDEDATFKLEFMTMKEFLRDYDWEGVFRRAEVESWLGD